MNGGCQFRRITPPQRSYRPPIRLHNHVTSRKLSKFPQDGPISADTSMPWCSSMWPRMRRLVTKRGCPHSATESSVISPRQSRRQGCRIRPSRRLVISHRMAPCHFHISTVVEISRQTGRKSAQGGLIFRKPAKKRPNAKLMRQEWLAEKKLSGSILAKSWKVFQIEAVLRMRLAVSK